MFGQLTVIDVGKQGRMGVSEAFEHERRGRTEDEAKWSNCTAERAKS
jgi:hypothetical protein